MGDGLLLAIGGHEDKTGERAILRAVAAAVAGGPLLLVTVATQYPHAATDEYSAVFTALGLPSVTGLDIRTRADALAVPDDVNRAAGVFLVGGDQLRITSQLAGTPLWEAMVARWHLGVVIAGTSAGAVALTETMIAGGPGEAPARVGAVEMAPGLGLLPGVTLDTHFDQRGRWGRLIAVVAQNPGIAGLGLDEDTAIAVTEGGMATVLGTGALSVVDGSAITYSSLAERDAAGVMTVCNARVHILAAGDRFDLHVRVPLPQIDPPWDAPSGPTTDISA